jgi:hypothetical protein
LGFKINQLLSDQTWMMHGEHRTAPADAANYAFLECLDDAVSGAPALFQGPWPVARRATAG